MKVGLAVTRLARRRENSAILADTFLPARKSEPLVLFRSIG